MLALNSASKRNHLRGQRSLLNQRKRRTAASSSNLITASFVRLRIPYTCTQPGPVLAPLRRDLARRTFRIWHRYGCCPALRRRFSAPLPLSPDARSPRASIVLTFHAFFLCCHLGHTGTSAISAQSKLKSEGASIRLQHLRRAACDPRLAFIFLAASFVPRRSILGPRPQVTRPPISRLRL